MSNIFEDTTMTLFRGTALGQPAAQGLAVQLETVNIPPNLQNGGVVTDWFDLYSLGWATPVPYRGDTFIDEQTGAQYSVYGIPKAYFDHVECRLTYYGSPEPNSIEAVLP